MNFSKKTKQILIVLVLAGVVIGGWAMWYVFFKPHRNVGSEKPAFTMTVDQLNTAFDESEDAISIYIDKAMLLQGDVTEVGKQHIAFGNIICNFEEANPFIEDKISVGQKMSVQGRVSTYNDLMDEIVLDKCIIKN
jgi:hypothetical protein